MMPVKKVLKELKYNWKQLFKKFSMLQRALDELTFNEKQLSIFHLPDRTNVRPSAPTESINDV